MSNSSYISRCPSCQICFEEYNLGLRKLHCVLSCGHSFCLECIDKLENKSKARSDQKDSEKECPICRKKAQSRFQSKGIVELISEAELAPRKQAPIEENSPEQVSGNKLEFVTI